jgi:flagellar biosynthetic protein FliP
MALVMTISRRVLRVAMIAALVVASLMLGPRASAQGLGPPLPSARPVLPERSLPPGLGVPGFDEAAPAREITDGMNGINPLEVLAGAAGALPGGKSSREGGSGEGEPRAGLSTAINILVVLTVVSLAPSVMLMTTCFVRILIVLGLLKQALGTATVPPTQVITALALFMTLMVMAPTIDRINTEAIAPYRAGEVESYGELWQRGKQPVRDFMFAQIEATGNWSSLYMMMEYRGTDTSRPETLTRESVDMVTLVPAYMLSELKVAFLMGFRVYLPFLVIDMVISTMLISMSMMMLPPVLISLPFKLLLFVLVDGWTLVVAGLMHSFAQPVGLDGVAMGQFMPLLGMGGGGADPSAMVVAAIQETRPWLLMGSA